MTCGFQAVRNALHPFPVVPDGVLRSVDEYTEEVRCSAEMDHVRWKYNYWRKRTGANTHIGSNPDACAAFLKEFIEGHMKTMDKAYPEPGE